MYQHWLSIKRCSLAFWDAMKLLLDTVQYIEYCFTIKKCNWRWKSDFTGSWIDVLHGVSPVQELMHWFVLCPPRVDAVQSNHSTCMQLSPDGPQHSPMPWLSSPLDCPTPCQSSNIIEPLKKLWKWYFSKNWQQWFNYAHGESERKNRVKWKNAHPCLLSPKRYWCSQ